MGLSALSANGHEDNYSVVVGGLGLGYTALTALRDPKVKELRTIDVMRPVIRWHQQGILPIGDELATDSRSQLVHGDFFAIATDDSLGFINNKPVHAILLDIDHSPSHWLNESNASFYNPDSLEKMKRKIYPGGVFGLWSNELPDPKFKALLSSVFSHIQDHTIQFANPYSGGESINSVYICTV